MQPQIERLTSWFIEKGGHIHPDIEFAFNEDTGIFARKREALNGQNQYAKLESGSTIISCPHGLTLSALDADSSLPSFSGYPARDKNENGVTLPQQVIDSAPRPQSLAALWLCIQKSLGEKSYWEPYIDCLPTPYNASNSGSQEPVSVLDTPLYWTEEEKSYFAGSPLEVGTRALENSWKLEFNAWWPCLEKLNENLGLEITWEEYKWAVSIFTSRAFSSSFTRYCHVDITEEKVENRGNGEGSRADFDPHVLLYPGFDILNHSPTTNNYWRTDAERVSLICVDEPKPGEEIFNCYGPRNNGQLLLCYGFALHNNPHDAFPLKLASMDFPLPPKLLSVQHSLPIDREPPKIPEAHDPSMTTFYIREPAAAPKKPNVGYPSHPVKDTVAALSGIPAALNLRLTSLILNAREKTSIINSSFLTEQTTSSTAFCYAVSARATLAFSALMLERFCFELKRLDKGFEKLSTFGAMNDDLPKRSTQDYFLEDSGVRKRKRSYSLELEEERSAPYVPRGFYRYLKRLRNARIYMESQRYVLSRNVDSIQRVIEKAIGTDVLGVLEPAITAFPQKSTQLLTLPRAIRLLRGLDAQAFEAAVRVLDQVNDATFNLPDVFGRARREDKERDYWAVWAGIAMITKNEIFRPSFVNHDERSVWQELLRQWLDSFSETYHSKRMDVDLEVNEDESTLAHVQKLISLIRQTVATEEVNESVRSFWSRQEWADKSFIALCTEIVQEETVSVKVRVKKMEDPEKMQMQIPDRNHGQAVTGSDECETFVVMVVEEPSIRGYRNTGSTTIDCNSKDDLNSVK